MDNVCIIGCGRQGTAAAYDILLYSKPKKLLLLDISKKSLNICNDKIKQVISSKTSVINQVINFEDINKLISILSPYDIMLSAVPYPLNPLLTKIALKAKISMVDLGGHTQNVIEQLKFSDQAKESNITIVPDCGMGPGMNITMGCLAIEKFDVAEDIFIWDGGLPQNPKPPWNYSLFFNIKGLTNEYDGDAFFLRNGKINKVSCFMGIEKLHFDKLGELEAAVTSGGLSTMPWTFEGKLNTLENKTLRYKGHWNEMIAYRQLGLFDENEIDFNGTKFSSRDFYHFLLEPKLTTNDYHDICLMRVDSYGYINGIKKGYRYEVIEEYDDKTGFMAMEKWTGWHASIVMQKIMDGSIKKGAHPIEKALVGKDFYNEIVKRDYNLTIKEIKVD